MAGTNSNIVQNMKDRKDVIEAAFSGDNDSEITRRRKRKLELLKNEHRLEKNKAKKVNLQKRIEVMESLIGQEE